MLHIPSINIPLAYFAQKDTLPTLATEKHSSGKEPDLVPSKGAKVEVTPLGQMVPRMPLVGHDVPRTPFYTFLSEQKERSSMIAPHLFSWF
jgi:hypothetical protein